MAELLIQADPPNLRVDEQDRQLIAEAFEWLREKALRDRIPDTSVVVTTDLARTSAEILEGNESVSSMPTSGVLGWSYTDPEDALIAYVCLPTDPWEGMSVAEKALTVTHEMSHCLINAARCRQPEKTIGALTVADEYRASRLAVEYLRTWGRLFARADFSNWLRPDFNKIADEGFNWPFVAGQPQWFVSAKRLTQVAPIFEGLGLTTTNVGSWPKFLASLADAYDPEFLTHIQAADARDAATVKHGKDLVLRDR